MENKEINWEERKWELFSTMCAAREGASYGESAAKSMDRIFREVDILLEEYKRG